MRATDGHELGEGVGDDPKIVLAIHLVLCGAWPVSEETKNTRLTIGGEQSR